MKLYYASLLTVFASQVPKRPLLFHDYRHIESIITPYCHLIGDRSLCLTVYTGRMIYEQLTGNCQTVNLFQSWCFSEQDRSFRATEICILLVFPKIYFSSLKSNMKQWECKHLKCGETEGISLKTVQGPSPRTLQQQGNLCTWWQLSLRNAAKSEPFELVVERANYFVNSISQRRSATHLWTAQISFGAWVGSRGSRQHSSY